MAKPKQKQPTATAARRAATKTTAPRRAPAPVSKSPPEEKPAASPLKGSESEYRRFLPLAVKLDPRDVIPFRADASLAHHNVTRGLAAVTPREKEARAELPTVDWKALRETPDLLLGVLFVAAQVDRDAPSPGRIGTLLKEARPLRDLLLTNAEGLAKAGLLPAREVAKIRAGKGSIDCATDCVQLAALLRRHAAAIAGKTPITEEQIGRADTIGTELLSLLRPARARRTRQASPETQGAAQARDRLWTLAVQRHERLRRVGMWLWGDDVDEHVPPLQSYAAPAKKPKGPPQ